MLKSGNKLLRNLIALFNKTEVLNLTSEDIQNIMGGNLSEYRDFMIKSLLSLDLSNYISDSYDEKIEEEISGFLMFGSKDKKVDIIGINRKYSSFDELKEDIFQKYKNSGIDNIDYLILQIESKEKNMFRSVVQIVYYNFSYEKGIDKDEYLDEIIKKSLEEREGELKGYLGANPSEVLEKLFTWKNLYFITLVDLFLSSQLGIDTKITGFRRPPKKKETGDGNSIYYLVDTISLEDYMEGIYNIVKKDLNGEVDKLLEKNVRTYIKFMDNEPAKAIARTLFHYSENKNFFLYNTGVVTVASSYTDKYNGDTDKYILKFKDFNVINGGQTTITLYQIYDFIEDNTKFNGENEILSYIFSLYFDGKKGEINELIKNKNTKMKEVEELLKNYFIFVKEFLFGEGEKGEDSLEETIGELNEEEKDIIDKLVNKIKQEKDIRRQSSIPYYSGFVYKIINKIFINEFLSLYGGKLRDELKKRFKNNDILFKIFIGLNNELLNKVSKYVNLQNRVLEKDLVASRPEVKLLGEYINKFYNFDLYDNKSTTKSFDLFNQSVFVYLSTIETSKGGFLGDKYFGPSYAKNNRGQLYLQENFYNKIWGFDIENKDIEKRVFFYLLESKILYNYEEQLLRQLDLKVDYIKGGSDLYILYVLAFLLRDKMNSINFTKMFRELGKLKPKQKENISNILNMELIDNKTIWDYLKESIEVIGKVLKESSLIDKAKKEKLYRLSKFDEKIAEYFGYEKESYDINDDFSWEDFF